MIEDCIFPAVQASNMTSKSVKNQVGAKLGLVGPSWAKLGPVVAEFGAKLGPSWARLDQVGTSWVQAGPGWANLGPVGAKSGPSWGQVGAKLDQVGVSWVQAHTKHSTQRP